MLQQIVFHKPWGSQQAAIESLPDTPLLDGIQMAACTGFKFGQIRILCGSRQRDCDNTPYACHHDQLAKALLQAALEKFDNLLHGLAMGCHYRVWPPVISDLDNELAGG